MKKIFTILILATLFVACSKEDVIVNTLPNQLSVSVADDESRVHLNSDKVAIWDSGDMLSVFYKNSANGLWRYTGKEGVRDGVVTKVSEPTNPSATFSAVYAVYPYNESTTISSEGIVSLTIPTEQTFMNGSYGKGDNIMVAVGENDNLSMKNVFGWVRIPMTGTGQKVSSITFKGNNEEILAGVATIDPYTQKITFAEGGAKELTLNCNDVALAEGAAEFYIAVAPQKFNGGFTVDILLANGDCVTKTTTNPITISRNHICPMSAVTNPHNPKPANNEIWYTNGSTTEATVPYKTGVFGANIVSNTYDADKECWVIKFDSDVTSIGDMAFYKCTSLISVTIPDSVTSIGKGAFLGCNLITRVTIPDSVISIGQQAFSNCTSLASVTIGDSVTSIGYYAFGGCKSLTSITIPDNVIEIGESPFSNCRSLTAFYGKFASTDNRCLVVDGVLKAFAIGSGLTEYSIPDSVTSIGESAFYNCSSLTSITIPDSVISIGQQAFYGCTSLTSVYYEGDLSAWCKISFGDPTANPCNKRAKLYIKGVELTDIIIPSDITEIKNLTFYGCSSIINVNIPNRVTSIGENAFHNCRALTSVTISDSVISIGADAFSYCISLTGITIPDSVISIGLQAFSNCTSLTSVTIGDGVTSIGTYAFNRCTSLKEVYCKQTTPPTLGSKAFDSNAADRKIYVPASDDDSVINAYKAKEYWSSYATSIEEYSF